MTRSWEAFSAAETVELERFKFKLTRNTVTYRDGTISADDRARDASDQGNSATNTAIFSFLFKLF